MFESVMPGRAILPYRAVAKCDFILLLPHLIFRLVYNAHIQIKPEVNYKRINDI